MGFIQEFKAFIQRGNVIDLAVGIIMGAAFGKIVASLVGDLILPPIGALIGGVNFNDLQLVLSEAKSKAVDGYDKPAAVLRYGAFLQAIFDFLIISFCVFVLVKGVNRLQKAKEEKPKEPSNEEKLLTEIRDLLKQRNL